MNKEILTLELNMNYICKDTIKKRKAVYGNNFPEIAELESDYLGIKITPQQVAYSLAILKQVRINFIKAKIEELQNVIDDVYDYIVHIEIKQLNHALQDSLKDYPTIYGLVKIMQNMKLYNASR